MAVEVMGRVWKNSPSKGNKLLLLLAIADLADDGGWAFPSQATLAIKCRVGRRAVQKMLDELELKGELVIFNRFDPTVPEQHFSNVYHLLKYGDPLLGIPVELRGQKRKRTVPSEQPDARGSVSSDGGVVSTQTLGSEQPDARVVNSDSHYSLQDSSVIPPHEEKEADAVKNIPVPTTAEEMKRQAELIFQSAVEKTNGNLGTTAKTKEQIKADIEEAYRRHPEQLR